MKVYKKIGIIFIIFLGIISVIFLSLPYFFQNQLFDLLEEVSQKELHAKLSFDKENSSLSFLPNFPNLTATITDLKIIGLDEFEGDTLIELNAAVVTFSTWQLIGSQEPKPSYITLNAPKIKLKRLKNGKENWNILKEKDEQEDSSDSLPKAEKDEFKTNAVLKGWRIKNASFIFEDERNQTFLEVKKLNHQAKGDFSKIQFDLALNLNIEQINWVQNGTRYLDNHHLNLNSSINIHQQEQVYQMKENSLTINQYQIETEGSLKIEEGFPNFDIQLSSSNQTFVSFLSVFFSDSWTKNFLTEGNVSLTGFMKGIWNPEKKQFPLSHLHFQIKDASFQYGKMPKQLQNINLDLLWSNQKEKGGSLQLKNLEAKIEKSQIKGNLSWQKEQIQGRLGANFELSELAKVFPLPGLILRGNLNMNAWAKGTWNESQLPKLNINTTLENGFAKIILFPKALENIQLALEVFDSTQSYEDLQANLTQFSFQVDEDSLFVQGGLQNYENPSFDFTANGVLNFTNLMKVIPFLNQEFVGRIYLDIESKGKIADNTFSDINNQGQIRFENFKWKSPDFAEEIKIIDASVLLQEKKAQIEEILFFYGKNDLTFKGQITDYMDYLFFPETGILKADLSISSRDCSFPFDADPTFTDIGQSQFQLPKNCDWQVSTNFEQLHFFHYNLEQVRGSFRLKEEVFSCSDFEFLKNDERQKLQFSYDSKSGKPALNYKFTSD